jgi:hypothetical protein
VRIISTDKNAVITDHFLVANPNIGLDVFDQMANMDGAIGVRQGGRYKDISLFHWVSTMLKATALKLGRERDKPNSVQVQTSTSVARSGLILE